MAAIGIFARPPRPGRVKTRLAASIGDPAATDVYRLCLAHALATVRESGLPYRLFLAEPGDDELFAGESPLPQQGANLGERMANALKQLQEELGQPGIIIGTDCLDIDASLLRSASRELHNAELVLAPAIDGGYVLIGCRRVCGELFADIEWSSSRVLRQTLANAQTLGLKVAQLATLRDIDTLADLDPYPELLALIPR